VTSVDTLSELHSQLKNGDMESYESYLALLFLKSSKNAGKICYDFIIFNFMNVLNLYFSVLYSHFYIYPIVLMFLACKMSPFHMTAYFSYVVFSCFKGGI
jgi:hypothetical protein